MSKRPRYSPPFRIEVPSDHPEKWDLLAERWMDDKGMDLLEMQYMIYQLALEKNEIPIFEKHCYDSSSLHSALASSFRILDSLIESLPANTANKRRLLSYIEVVDSLAGYNRLFNNFAHLLTEDEYIKVIEKGKRLFDPVITAGWHKMKPDRNPQELSVIEIRR